jgi:hypothetical protein
VAGHRQNNFCGDGIAVRMGLRNKVGIRTKLRAVGCFRVCEPTNQMFSIGTKMTSLQLDAQVAGLPLREARISEEVDGVTVTFDSSERHAWHYPWTSHKSKMDVRHIFQVFCFQTCEGSDDDSMECFWTGDSASFRVMSMRRMLGKGGKTRRTDVLGTGTQTKRRQWVRNTINEKRIKINEIVVPHVSDASKWVKSDLCDGYHPPAGVRNWTVEAGHYDAFFDYVKSHCGLETPVFSNKKRAGAAHSYLGLAKSPTFSGSDIASQDMDACKRQRGGGYTAAPLVLAAPSRSSLSTLLYPGAPTQSHSLSHTLSSAGIPVGPVLASGPSALSARLLQPAARASTSHSTSAFIGCTSSCAAAAEHGAFNCGQLESTDMLQPLSALDLLQQAGSATEVGGRLRAAVLASQLGAIASHCGDDNDSFTNDVQELFSLGVLPKNYTYQTEQPMADTKLEPIEPC